MSAFMASLIWFVSIDCLYGEQGTARQKVKLLVRKTPDARYRPEKNSRIASTSL